MSSSLILSNCLFCGLAALLLFPLLKHPKSLLYKDGTPILLVIILILGKLLIPYEFSFTRTLASKNILPTINRIQDFHIYIDITLGISFLWICSIITLFFSKVVFL